MKTIFGKQIDTHNIRKNQYGNYRHVTRRKAERYTRRHGGKVYLFNHFWNYLPTGTDSLSASFRYNLVTAAVPIAAASPTGDNPSEKTFDGTTIQREMAI